MFETTRQQELMEYFPDVTDPANVTLAFRSFARQWKKHGLFARLKDVNLA